MTARKRSTETETTMKIEQQRLNLGSGNFRLSDSPIERVVEDGEDAEKVVRVKLLVVVSHLKLVKL